MDHTSAILERIQKQLELSCRERAHQQAPFMGDALICLPSGG
jgi:hypothetical protein